MIVSNRKHTEKHTKKRLKQILIFTVFLLLLITPATSASVKDASGTVYTTYDQIYASTTLSSSEKLSLIQEMAGWTPELEAYVKWKNSGGLEAYQAAVSGGNNPSSDYGWDEAPGDGLGDGGTNTEPEYSYQERQAYDAAYEAYQAEFAENYAATAAYTGRGSGTQADPYIVTTPAQLQEMANDLDAYYKLNNDIYLSSSWSPIGSVNAPFSGVIDGNGHTIYLYDKVLIAYAGSSTYKNIIIDGQNNNILPYNYGNIGMSAIIIYAIDNSDIIFQKIGVQNLIFNSGSHSGIGINSGLYISYAGANVNVDVIDSYIRDVRIIQEYIGGSASYANLAIMICTCANCDISNVYLYNCVLTVNGGNYAVNQNYGVGISYVSDTADISNSIVVNTDITVANSRNGLTAEPFININHNQDTFSDLYQYDVLINNAVLADSSSSYRGQNLDSAPTKAFFENTLNYNFNTNWVWNSETNRPDLLFSIPPTITAISVTPTTGGQQNTYTLSVSASSSAEGGISYYEWYSREGINDNWVLISNTSVSTTTFIPGSNVIGDVYFKCVVTGADGGVTDSWNAGFTSIKITVSPEAFVPNQQAWSITSEPLEIEKTTTNTYNPTNQFALDRDIIESRFISKSEAILVYGNAVYRVTADTNMVTPISSNHNGDVIVDSYIGLNHAVVVDSQGKIVRYNYSDENTVGIIADNVKDLVCNDNYIVVSTSDNEVLIFSTISGELLSYVDEVSVDSMDISSANDYVVFSNGVTLKSITNLASTSPVITTLFTLNGDITSINHVRNTNNFIITTTTSTYVVSIGSNGISYTQVSVSSDGIGLDGISFNTLSNYVGYKDETIYWYDSESVNQGSAELVSDINTVSMAYQNGLWTAFGGNSMTLFVSTQNNGVWETIQSIVLDNIVRDVALSDSGYYMVSSTDNTLYLFSRATPLDVSDTILTTKYYLEITTYVNGIITSGQTFSVSAQGVGSTSYTTDSSGTYTIEVYPTYTYEITYGGETIIYVANNYALQYLNLDTGVEYYLDGVTYSTNFQDNAIINMYYQDTNNHDNLVRYYIVDTDNVLLYDSGTQQTNNFFAQYSLNTDEYVKVVLTITRYDGGAVTISDGNIFTSAWNYIKRTLVGDDGFTVILPDAKKPLFPLELPMIDGAQMTFDIKQIFFCGVLMVIAGLFGVNHSARGTLILGLVALVFTFFKFIYIDWAWVMTMVVIGVLTVFSYSQNN